MKKFLLPLTVAVSAALAQQPKFYTDDPLLKEPAPLNIEKAKARKLSDYYDLFSHQFGKLGERHPQNGPPIRAKAVNTLGEPMDGAWYTHRHYFKRMTKEELEAGPGNRRPPAGQQWTVVGAKSEGITPGFTILDGNGQRYFIKFDPISNPEMATAADSISSRFFYALGYHVPENYIIQFDPEQLKLGDDVELADSTGRKRKMTRRDIYEILVKVPKSDDGLYRATASRAIDGKPMGPPRYYGTRRDDPNDIVPHEHRRDLRGLHVFCAWLDHDDSRSINNYDALVKENGVQFFRHYLLDFGSTLGSGSQRPNSARSGAYFFTWKGSAKQLGTLGLMPPYWALARYQYFPSIGYIEGDVFDPDLWVPEYPNPAFINRLPDDEFWAAKQVMAFTDEDIKTLVATGELSDGRAETYLVEVLKKRRDKIGAKYFAKVLPFDRFRLDTSGKLLWDDLSKSINDAKVAWFSYDNKTGTRTPAANSSPSGYSLAVVSSATRPKQTIEVYLRDGNIIGIDRHW
ncbi:hypothetical protein F183_A11180 [Bryobacterales bacterium F-183]|nr:hypothetical protein F183_A11180 [Bryobacterales bacterium F-183]